MVEVCARCRGVFEFPQEFKGVEPEVRICAQMADIWKVI